MRRWRKTLLEAELLAGPHADPAKELERLRRESELLRQERGLFKKATVFFTKEGNR